jgi:hypothetical protein
MANMEKPMPKAANKELRKMLEKELRSPVEEAMEAEGITPKLLASILKKKLEAKEVRTAYDKDLMTHVESSPLEAHGPQLQALDMSFKLIGGYKPQSHDVTMRDGDMDTDERDALKEVARDMAMKLRSKKRG